MGRPPLECNARPSRNGVTGDNMRTSLLNSGAVNVILCGIRFPPLLSLPRVEDVRGRFPVDLD